MKKLMAGMLAVVMLAMLGAGCALADQAVQLPENSRYTIQLPDGMEYDGPGKLDKASFAYVSESLGLDVIFSCSDGSQVRYLEDMIPVIEDNGMEDVQMVTVRDIPMIVYRYTPDDPAEMKCIGYIFQDGNLIQQIAFWYGTQKAADQTKIIMESIETGK